MEAWRGLVSGPVPNAAEAVLGIIGSGSGAGTSAALAATVLREMLMTPIKLVLAVVLSVGLIGTGAGLFVPRLVNADENKAVAAKKDATAKEMKRLQGEWKVVELVEGGDKVGDDEIAIMCWVIKGNGIQGTDAEGTTKKLTFKLDPAKNPKHIDLTEPPRKGVAKGKQLPAIYKLENDRLTICVPGDKALKDGRPRGFDTGMGVAVITLDRAKK